MLEKIPHAVGAALSGLKAGLDRTAYHSDFADVPEGIGLTSLAFEDGAAIPARFTADGIGSAPPLAWSGLPAGTARVVVLVEDAGSPTPNPLVHLIAWNLDPAAPLAEGAASQPQSGLDLGQNSFLKAGWLPPDPPTGHGPHAYLFQAYALDTPLTLAEHLGRGALLEAMQGHVLAKGCLTGNYGRV
ncbi:YbhB/YbcL family Raf kinase inhibitor-like protein [Methylobacterium sp. J-068]|uniref:YbhB/YbcL family Raf kinase inhibitor-like protein n=1 Tax=Methylobacterium sp. J-068 TaxID=2836649 RepID=UPI001FB946C0|nr:YbhB/YbcL family Raf kinase inhibitor-like protein [Methylobacterium sp. J-068]MCJ2034399.1 YbhB/YbcL family Raf kinase inhibitor-like protein [Methylobacterium sp. J-068]